MLKAENLTLNVDDEGGKKCLLNNISFQVDDGEMLVITGPNGGGKSTLAKTLIGIQTPDSGKIILDGQDITELDINHRANAGIGFAFQQPPRFKGMTRTILHDCGLPDSKPINQIGRASCRERV